MLDLGVCIRVSVYLIRTTEWKIVQKKRKSHKNTEENLQRMARRNKQSHLKGGWDNSSFSIFIKQERGKISSFLRALSSEGFDY